MVWWFDSSPWAKKNGALITMAEMAISLWFHMRNSTKNRFHKNTGPQGKLFWKADSAHVAEKNGSCSMTKTWGRDTTQEKVPSQFGSALFVYFLKCPKFGDFLGLSICRAQRSKTCALVAWCVVAGFVTSERSKNSGFPQQSTATKRNSLTITDIPALINWIVVPKYKLKDFQRFRR